MSYELFFAALLQTLMTFTFVAILTPFRRSVRKMIPALCVSIGILCLAAGWLAGMYGMGFIAKWGFLIISFPAFFSGFLLSSAKGIRYLFVVLTALIFHQMLSSVLMVIRIYQNGYTFLYFFLNLLLFGALIAGGLRLRTDFHQIVIT